MLGVKRREPGSFQWCPVTGQEAKCTNRNTKGSFSTSGDTFLLWGWLSAGRGWLPREIVESPSLELLKKMSGHDPGHLGLDVPAWAAGLDQVASRVAFQPQPFYDSVIIILVKKQWTKKVKMAKARVSIVLRHFIVYLEIMKCLIHIPGVLMVVGVCGLLGFIF